MRPAVSQRSLLKDPQGLLIQQTKNVQAARQLPFTSVQQLHEQAPVIRDYINEAIAVEKSGKKVPMKKHAKTREARIEKYYEKILAGKGPDD